MTSAFIRRGNLDIKIPRGKSTDILQNLFFFSFMSLYHNKNIRKSKILKLVLEITFKIFYYLKSKIIMGFPGG